jgi:predicted phosphoribosyltransferase
MTPIFRDRRDAGRVLARLLRDFAGRSDVVVLALPRGGVPVGFEVACVLGVPLDVFVVRKLGVPGQEELAFGAIASGGVRVLNRSIFDELHLTPDELEAVTAREQAELARRERVFRGGQPQPDLTGRTVLLVDDGLATGSTARAALRALRRLGPSRVVLAVPVAPADTLEMLAPEADEIICAATPDDFLSVGAAYLDFDQTSDAEVRELLSRSRVAATGEGRAEGERE